VPQRGADVASVMSDGVRKIYCVHPASKQACDVDIMQGHCHKSWLVEVRNVLTRTTGVSSSVQALLKECAHHMYVRNSHGQCQTVVEQSAWHVV